MTTGLPNNIPAFIIRFGSLFGLELAEAIQQNFEALAAGGSIGPPVQVPYNPTIPLNGSTYMTPYVIIAPTVITVSNTPAPVVGGYTYLTLIADGVNVPTFMGATELGGTGWDNTAGAVNVVRLSWDGTTAYYTILQTVVSPPSSNRPSVVNSSWTQVFWRDFDVTGVISLNSANTDDGILADTGEYKPATARYRNGASAGGTYSGLGLPGFGFDIYTDPTLPGNLPLEYTLARPLGEFEPLIGLGIRMHTRPSTGPDMTAAMQAEFPDHNGSITHSVPLWCSAYLSTYRKIAAAPPFARVTFAIPRNDAAAKFFAAFLWSTEDGNHAYPNDTLHHPFEYDDHEFLGWGTGNLGSSTSIHAYDSGGTAIDEMIGLWDSGSLVGHLIGYCTIFDLTQVSTYRSLDGGPWTLIPGSVTPFTPGSPLAVALMRTGGNVAEYQQVMTGFLHDASAGFPWQLAAGAPVGTDLKWDLVKDGLFAPTSNSTVVVPPATVVPEVTFTPRGSYGTDTPDNLPVGTPIGDLVVPSGVVSVRVMVGGGRLKVIGTQVQVANAGLDYTSQPNLTFAFEGTKTDGTKSTGRIYSLPVSSHGGIAWDDVRAKIALNPQLPRAYTTGTLATYANYISGVYTALTALSSQMPGRAAAGVAVWKFHGLNPGVYGLWGSDLDADQRFAVQYLPSLAGATASFKVGGFDHILNGIAATALDAVCVVVSWGSDGIGLWCNGSDGIFDSGTWSSSGTTSSTYLNWNDGYGDRAVPFGSQDQFFCFDPAAVGGTAGLRLTNAEGKALAVHL